MNIEKYNKKFRWIKNLKDKKNPNDNKKTPIELAKELIKITPFKKNDLVFDGFYGNGVWYNNFPTYVNKKWSEINPKYTPNNKSID